MADGRTTIIATEGLSKVVFGDGGGYDRRGVEGKEKDPI